jgi:CHAD domain-containing protein
VLLQELAGHYAVRGLAPDFAPSFAAYLRARRDEATLHVKEALPPARLERHGLRVLELAARAFDAPTLGALAGPHLEARLAEVVPLLPIIEEPSEVERHHALRIALKHLRYALEILGAVWPAQLPAEATVLPLKRLQDALGELNDAQDLLGLAREHRADVVHDGPALDALIADLGELGVTRYEAARAAVRELGPDLVERLVAAATRGLER